MSYLNKIVISLCLSSTLLTADTASKSDADILASLIGDMMNRQETLSHAINLAGKQRMLSQRIAKLALLIATHSNEKINIKKLETFAKLYDQTLKGFKKGDSTLDLPASTNQEVLTKIALVETVWKPFYENIQKIIKEGAEAKKAVIYIIKHNEELLKVSDELVKALEKSNTSTDYLSKFRLHVVNLAGRQRMLIQKMTKEKLLVSGLKQNAYKGKLKESIELFDNSLTALIKGNKKGIVKPTDEKLKAQLNKVETHWSKLKPLYLNDNISKQDLLTLIKENPILLKEMNDAVHLAEVVLEY